MGQHILKGAPDRDLYCLWSVSADALMAVGTRQDFLDAEASPESLRLADVTGSSTGDKGDSFTYGLWTQELLFLVHAGIEGFVRRTQLADLLQILLDDDPATEEDRIRAMLVDSKGRALA